MRNIFLVTVLALTIMLSLACSPSRGLPGPLESESKIKPSLPAPAEISWEAEWERTLIEAKKEGRLLVYQAGGQEVRDALARAFKEKYGIKAEFVTATGSEVIQKVLTERRSGLYLPDVYLGGASVIILSLKPAGAVERLEPALILPEVTNPKSWWDGKLPFIDKERFYLIFILKSNSIYAINSNFVNPDEIRSLNDLLNPKWKGKMIMLPTFQVGPGNNWFGFILHRMGEDYLRKLAKQEPLIVTDRRLQIDWLAHGKYSMALAYSDEFLIKYSQAGATQLVPLMPAEGTYLNAGPGGVALMNRASHPKAARIFINWLLTREGQTVYTKAYPIPSAREDVSTEQIHPNDLRKPGVSYFNTQTEEYLLGGDERMKLAREIFGHLLK